MSLLPSLPMAFQICFLVSILTTTLFFSLRLLGYIISIGAIRPLSLHKLSYEHGGVTISSSRIEVSFQLPRPSNPTWSIIKVHDYEYKDTKNHVSITELRIILWFFPVLLNATRGPWASVELHDFRVRVFSSTNTPSWMQELRKNLVATILNGETIQLDDFNTKLLFSTTTGTGNALADEVDRPGVAQGGLDDEARVSVVAKLWRIRNWMGRLYTFGQLEAELRRSWVDDRGSFVMVAKECKWKRLASYNKRETVSPTYFLLQAIQAVLLFPFDIISTIWDPSAKIDLYVSRCDVTFDIFRVRDAELFKQGAGMLKRQYDIARNDGALQGMSWDVFFQAVLTVCS